jgi:PAS domain S-box-containing protein
MFRNIKLNISYRISALILLIVAVSVSVISILQYQKFWNLSKEVLSAEELQKLSEKHGSMQGTYLLSVVLVLLATAVLALLFSRWIASPLVSLKEYLRLTEQGILPNAVNISTGDEIGEMAGTVNNVVQSLKSTAQFAKNIGEGNLNAQFTSLGENDVLGNSLLNMQKSLIDADKREKERNWIVNGIAEVGEILRRHTEMEPLSLDVVKYMIEKIGAVQGAFYVAEEDDDTGKRFIIMKNCYAYNRKKYYTTKFKFGEGLVGQSAIEMATIFRTEIPDDYCTITSGLIKDKKPNSILIVPLITNETIYGVIEFASLLKFNENQIRFVEEVGPIIARTIFNIYVNARTQRHLEQSQRMSAELQQQQEELRQNAEEMRATQEDLQIANASLEEQMEEVNRTQKRMQSLLENSSEVITIYENDGRVRYISPSVVHILGIQSKELVGTKDESHIHNEDLQEFKSMFRRLLVNPDVPINLQYRYRKNNGEWIWLEATGKNLLADQAVKGIVVNARDITLKRKAEMEERMRKNMQALSENSPDLITRLSSDGVITYTNPVIENYTGVKPTDFMNLALEQVKHGNGMVHHWREILGEVLTKKEKLHLEANYNSPLGERIMQVNAIPEYNDSALESVLVVSHDITEMKLIQREIQAKNKNIHESITYSKRIQNAIIPDTRLIQTKFPESFILYKPRDIVSGDFPWYMQKDDNIFISAVDCTGHGVPGAMLSLVGYFQLNNIVDAHPDMSSSEILDEFDKKVNDTLIKDTNEENIKDGMDIAFCKINMKKKRVEYSGAHRPLYLIRKGELTEFKGDKWAIGGGVYKNQTHFTNHSIDVKPGDTIFFFSDGFPDQFGGPQNRKFGTAKIKEVICANQTRPMADIHDALLNEFELWKGEGKQTDDVLLIGIRF